MRTMRRVGVALLTALALSTPVFARRHRAVVRKSRYDVLTTAGVDYTLNDRATLVGEFGVLKAVTPRARRGIVAIRRSA